MPIETVPGTDLRYYLICHDEDGRERSEPGGRMSRLAKEAIAGGTFTDVFLFSHGWLGDVPSAREQYRKWIGAMAACPADLRRMRRTRAGFRPLLIGLHWPSKPWGDDDILEPGAAAFAAGVEPLGDEERIEHLEEECAGRVSADSPASREALRTILASALEDPAPARFSPEVRAAYRELNRWADLGAGGADAPPHADREPFDPEAAYRAALAGGTSFGMLGPLGDAVLSPLRSLSFWRMKALAARFGEGGAHRLLAGLHGAVPKGLDVRFHVMGHSFGCIVASAAIAGPARGAAPLRVHSLALVQGALSIWSYCSAIPHALGHPGYFRRLIAERRVSGPIVATQSVHDSAVGRWYPYAAGVAGQVAFPAPGGLPPKYAAIGTFGVQGPGVDLVSLPMNGDLDGPYHFKGGKVYNIDASPFIIGGGGLSGAHSEIDKPQVAHAIWEAAGA